MSPAQASEGGRMIFGAVADDLTGGAELASMLVARGVRTRFTIGGAAAEAPDPAAHVIALKTRVIPAGDAVRQVTDAAESLLSRGARQIFFKYCATFDSTPAGNIGPCAEALMERLGCSEVLFMPALCETGRTVYQGHVFGGPQLLSESSKRFDPLTPMTDSNIVRVLQAQSRRKVGLIDHAAVDAGPSAVLASCARQVEREGASLFIADALYERDLVTLAQAVAGMPLATGNSSVVAHFPPLWFENGLLGEPASVRLPGIDGPGAVLVGSVAPQTMVQLDRFALSHPVLTLDLDRAFAGDDLVSEALAFATDAITAGRQFAISTAQPHAEVERLQAAHGRAEAAGKAEAILSSVARGIVFDGGVRRLIVAGGETSGSVLAALGIGELDVGPYREPGSSRCVARAPLQLAVMLKSGKLGPPDIFETVLADMRRPIAEAPLLDRWPPRSGR